VLYGERPELPDSEQLAHVRWLGGGSGAGKSTIARLIAAAHGVRVFSTDDSIADHARRSTPAELPLLHKFIAMDMDERWVNRSPSVMFETFHGFHGEGFELIIEDLLELPDDPPILVEGFRLLPRLVAPLLSRPDQAVWLVPTPEFRRGAFEARGFTWEIPNRTRDPERALANLLARDALFTAELASEAAAWRLPVIRVDIEHSLEHTWELVARALGLPARRTDR
jgi:2-phosphoglycerate kinase